MSVLNTHAGAVRIGAVMEEVHARGGSVFCIGIGGVMMASIARLTARFGFPVSGSDRTRSDTTSRLEAEGIRVYPTHDADHIPADCGAVVYTVAISEDNPEYRAAKERQIPCFSRADYIGWLMTGYRQRVGVAGMHGKSTCTSMCTRIFLEAGTDPTVLIGADYPPIGGAFRAGREDYFLLEACEYMDSFLDLSPTVAVLLGAELEHVDYFSDLEQIINSFARFAGLTGRDGVVICNADDRNVTEAAERARSAGKTGRVVTFACTDPQADVYAQDISVEQGNPTFVLWVGGENWGMVRLAVPGRHQVYNALAAIAVGWVCGLPREAILRGIEAFRGVSRRMEYRGDINGARVYDDYGHHPTEIRATLEGAVALTGTRPDGTPGRLLCVFQPHTYSRLAMLYKDFLSAFAAADKVCLLDVYAARETDIQGVSSEMLAHDLGERAVYAPDPLTAAAVVRADLLPGDVAVIMGAGDVTRVSDLLFPESERGE